VINEYLIHDAIVYFSIGFAVLIVIARMIQR
jgi:hypothetical protein